MKPSEPRRYVRQALDTPDFRGLDGAQQVLLNTASRALSCLKPIAPQAVATAADSCFTSLTHELSDHYLALNEPPASESRSPAEAEALRRLEAEPEGLAASDPLRFRERLAGLNRSLTGNDRVWRGGAIRLGGDRAGNRVYFPPVAAVSGQLEKVRLALATADEPPLFRAAVAYALLLNGHPFCDGNGRTARVLFNHVLRRAGMPGNVYLPLYEIARRARGGRRHRPAHGRASRRLGAAAPLFPRCAAMLPGDRRKRSRSACLKRRRPARSRSWPAPGSAGPQSSAFPFS